MKKAATGGILSDKDIEKLIKQGAVWAEDEITPEQIQPASLDLRLSDVAYRLRASFLPGRETFVSDNIERLAIHEIDLREGAVLETGGVYIVPLQEYLDLEPEVSAFANPKSSTGRIDVFTRVVVDRGAFFDQIEAGYQGFLYLEISPRTFPIRVRRGSKLAQMRFRRGSRFGLNRKLEQAHLHFGDRPDTDLELQLAHLRSRFGDNPDPDLELLWLLELGQRLTSGKVDVNGGLGVRVGLRGDESGVVGYRARRHTDCIDVDKRDHPRAEYWEPVHADSRGTIVLDPGEFYILASQEKLCVPPSHGAVMAPFDPLMGEVRVHYAGFFDPGFGMGKNGVPSAQAVLEVRGYDVPFILEDGQIIARLIYERLLNGPGRQSYGSDMDSNYQYQELRLSKHFL